LRMIDAMPASSRGSIGRIRIVLSGSGG